MSTLSRRKFLKLGALALPLAATGDTRFAEALRVTSLNVNGTAKCRFIHFSDFHFQGDEAFAGEVITKINDLRPQFVCFTGDLVENRIYATEALRFISEIRSPVYGIPGNHDYISQAPFDQYTRAFAATGGAWIPNTSIVLPEHDLELFGNGIVGMPSVNAPAVSRQVLLMHYPEMADHLGGRRFDLILAGHSHGGQVRIPFLGPLRIPSGVGPYDYGHYQTKGGPLYVSAGIGTLSTFPVRWNCPPELTVVTI